MACALLCTRPSERSVAENKGLLHFKQLQCCHEPSLILPRLCHWMIHTILAAAPRFWHGIWATSCRRRFLFWFETVLISSGGRFVQTFSKVCVSLQSLQLEHFLQTFFDILQTFCRLFLTFCRLFADFIWLVNHLHADFLQTLCPGDYLWTDFVHTNSVLGRLFADLMHTNSVQMITYEQT